MTTWESGRATEHLNDIIAGLKTVEGRLNSGKFAKYKPGDTINIREDIYNLNGDLIKEIPNRCIVEIVKIGVYKDFYSMLLDIGFKKALPRAISLDEAIDTYHQFYSLSDESKYGVLGIHIKQVI